MDSDYWQSYELSAAVGARSAMERLVATLNRDHGAPHPLAAIELDLNEVMLLPVPSSLVSQLAAGASVNYEENYEAGGATGGPPSLTPAPSSVLTGPDSGFANLTPVLVGLLELASGGGDIAYIEADYVGMNGRQAAAVWVAGRLRTGPLLLGRGEIFDPRSAPINVALRALGVPSGNHDPFLVAGLHRHRQTEEWQRMTEIPPRDHGAR